MCRTKEQHVDDSRRNATRAQGGEKRSRVSSFFSPSSYNARAQFRSYISLSPQFASSSLLRLEISRLPTGVRFRLERSLHSLLSNNFCRVWSRPRVFGTCLSLLFCPELYSIANVAHWTPFSMSKSTRRKPALHAPLRCADSSPGWMPHVAGKILGTIFPVVIGGGGAVSTSTTTAEAAAAAAAAATAAATTGAAMELGVPTSAAAAAAAATTEAWPAADASPAAAQPPNNRATKRTNQTQPPTSSPPPARRQRLEDPAPVELPPAVAGGLNDDDDDDPDGLE